MQSEFTENLIEESDKVFEAQIQLATDVEALLTTPISPKITELSNFTGQELYQIIKEHTLKVLENLKLQESILSAKISQIKAEKAKDLQPTQDISNVSPKIKQTQMSKRRILLDPEADNKENLPSLKEQCAPNRVPFEDLSQISANKQPSDFLRQSYDEKTSDEKMKFYTAPIEEKTTLRRSRSSLNRRQTPILELFDKIYKVVVQQHKGGIHQDEPESPTWIESDSIAQDENEDVDPRLNLIQEQVKAEIERNQNKRLYLEPPSQKLDPSCLKRLHSWLQKINTEYLSYKSYVNSGMKYGKKYIRTTSQQFNMTQYICAIKSFQLKNSDLDDHELIRKWIHLSNKEIEQQFLEGLSLLYELEAKYKKIQLEKKRTQSYLMRFTHGNQEPNLSFLNDGYFYFDLVMVMEVIDLV